MDLSDVMLKMDGKMILIFNSKTWDFQTRIILIKFFLTGPWDSKHGTENKKIQIN